MYSRSARVAFLRRSNHPSRRRRCVGKSFGISTVPYSVTHVRFVFMSNPVMIRQPVQCVRGYRHSHGPHVVHAQRKAYLELLRL